VKSRGDGAAFAALLLHLSMKRSSVRLDSFGEAAELGRLPIGWGRGNKGWLQGQIGGAHGSTSQVTRSLGEQQVVACWSKPPTRSCCYAVASTDLKRMKVIESA
jgi:hypothetical protein